MRRQTDFVYLEEWSQNHEHELFKINKGGIEIMNKNFKRLISTVAALAMAASSFVAMAATYPDVKEDATYYTAVEKLSALGIIDGFDDGTFKPDEKVTRAQMAKLVVGAKNMLAEAEGNTRQVFVDVAPGKSEWAMGYVATAADYGIVNGTNPYAETLEENTFDPDATVTYMQAMKMLVNACNYEDWAQDQGGWPEGYRYYGNELKIGAGVKGVSDDTEMTRGQIAQMISNAMSAPVLDIVGYERDNGEKYPIYDKMDGEDGNKFKTLLTEKWDTYEVNGRVMATSRSGATDADEVNYRVENSKNFDGEAYKMQVRYETRTEIIADEDEDPADANDEDTVIEYEVPVYSNCVTVMGANAADTAANDLFLEYSYALINVNEDDEAKIVYIESAGKNKSVEIDGDLIADSSTTTRLDVYKNENTNSISKYKISAAAQMLINGVIYDLPVGDTILDAIADYATGKVVLVDTPQEGVATIDGEYDYIVVDYYATGVVDEVFAEEETVEIVFSLSNSGEDELIVDLESEDKTYSFVDTAGNEVDPATIAENSVISVAYDVAGWDASAFYNVIVSTDKAEGRVSSSYTDASGTDWYVVNGKEYKWADTTPNLGFVAGPKTFTIFLDKDGNIAKSELLATSVNYAIIDRFYESAGDSKVRLILKDGTKVDYILAANTEVADADVDDETYTTLAAAAANGEDTLQERFVTYTLNKNNEVKLVAVTDAEYNFDNDAQWSERASRIGSYGIAETSVILDASAYATNAAKAVGVSSATAFIEDMNYGVVVLGERDQSTATYPMAIIISGNGGYTVNTRMAVVASAVSTVEIDGVLKSQIDVFNGANEVVTLVDDTSGLLDGLEEGDAIIYYTDADGEVADLVEIFSVADNAELLKNNANIFGASSVLGTIAEYDDTDDDATGPDFAINGLDATETVEFALYPVIKKYATSIIVPALAPIDTDDVTEGVQFGGYESTVADSGVELDYAVDAVAYEYDGTVRKNFVDSIATSSVKASSFRSSAIDQATNEINMVDTDNKLAYVLVRLVDDEIQEAYSIYFK